MAGFAGIELGGTKTVLVRGHPGAIEERIEYPTTDPAQTLGRAVDAVRAWNPEAIGIASFGPIRVAPDAPDFGTMLDTPKRGWKGAAVVKTVAAAFDCPVSIDTDVNAAALAEHRFGAAKGCNDVVYITIGTGVGGGVVVRGKPVHGLLHPELGHVRLRRAAGDCFAGACPFHGDCIEGLIAGSALTPRLGRHPSRVSAGDPVWNHVAQDLAELLAMLCFTLSPQRIVVGGGVTNRQPHLLPAARARVPAILAGYLRDVTAENMNALCVAPVLGDDAGPMGALIVAATGFENADYSIPSS